VRLDVLVVVDFVLLQSPDMLPLEDSVLFGRQIANDQRKRDDGFSYSNTAKYNQVIECAVKLENG